MCKLAFVMFVLLGLIAALYAAAPVGWVCFAAEDGKVYLVKVGGSVVPITANVGAKHARFSADGMLIFYLDKSAKIWAMNNDGTNAREIGDGMNSTGSTIASYSPDPACVLAVQGGKFYKINAHSKVKTQVADSKQNSMYGEISISKDGTRIGLRPNKPSWFNVTTGEVKQYNEFASAAISPNGEILLGNNPGHQECSIYSFDGSTHTEIRKVGYLGAIGKGDNHSFAVNSDDWAVALDDHVETNYGRRAGIFRVDGSEAYKVAEWSSTAMYPSFFLGDLPNTAVQINPDIFTVNGRLPGIHNSPRGTAMFISPAGMVSLWLINAKGQSIELINNKYLAEGTYALENMALNHFNGVWLYRLQTGNQFKSGHLLINH